MFVTVRIQSVVKSLAWFSFLFDLCNGVSVRFAQEDFGFVNETSGSFIPVTVERIGEVKADFTVIIKLNNSTSDFHTNSWTLLFRPGDVITNKSANLFVRDDDLPEDNETFQLSLFVTPAQAAEIEQPSIAHVTISANDDANGIIGFASTLPIEVNELSNQNATVSMALVRERGTFGNVTVSFQVSGTQEELNDLSPVRGTVALEDGESNKVFQIQIIDDMISENDEEFEVMLVETTGGLKINPGSNTSTIRVRENDSPLRFSQKVYRVEEEESTLEVIVFRGMDKNGQNRVGPDQGMVLVDYEVIPGTATPGLDFNVKSSGSLVFNDGKHSESLEIYIKDDVIPELSENFSIRLLPGSVQGDAIVAEPSECMVVIETNDDARGVLSIDFSSAEHFENSTYFMVDEDGVEPFLNISLRRRGGTFSTVSVQWMVQMNVTTGNGDIFDVVTPTSGTLVFEAGQKRSNIRLKIIENSLPEEAKLLSLKLLPGSVLGGAVLDPPLVAQIVVSDSDVVYGIFDIDVNGSYIDIHSDSHRDVVVELMRRGGLTGDVELRYSGYYYPPNVEDVNNALPGILTNPNGKIVFKPNEMRKTIVMAIENDAFLETGSKFSVTLDSVELLEANLLVPAKTPAIGVKSLNIDVSEEYANGEVGFASNSVIEVEEPDERPLDVALELRRQGLAGIATVQVSYRSNADVKENFDYIRGPEVVTFEPGQRNHSIRIQVLPDHLPELEEVIIIRLDSIEPSNQKLNRYKTETTVVILENDNPGGVFRFSNQSLKHYVIREEGSETVNVVVERDKGALAQRMVAYEVTPNGAHKFYGDSEVLVFRRGETSTTISLVPHDDDIPELDHTYSLVLQPYGTPLSVIVPPSLIHVTILANDNPFGLFVFGDDSAMPRIQSIGESGSGGNISVHFRVLRTMGKFGNVSVDWMALPRDTDDITPVQGTLFYLGNETEKVITIQSSMDDVPESLERFTIILLNASGGANIKEGENATMIIEPNDKEIYFKDPGTRYTEEGGVVTLTVLREGSGSDATSIRYKTRNASSLPIQRQATSDLDYRSVHGDVINFPPGVRVVDVTIHISDDDLPEEDESFYVELYDAIDDYVAYDNDKVEIVIRRNDVASGVFFFSPPHHSTLEEGIPHNFTVLRNRGRFGDVTLKWEVISGGNRSYQEIREMKNEKGFPSEFVKREGILYFAEGTTANNISIEAISDNLPEYDEFFTLFLANVTSGDGELSANESELVVDIVVSVNDHPHGLLSFVNSTSAVTLSEDGAENNDVTIEVERSMGSDGHIMALWELRPQNSTLPPFCTDLFLGSELFGGATFVEGRKNINTPAVKFVPDSFVRSRRTTSLQSVFSGNFSFSVWVRIDQDHSIPDPPDDSPEDFPLLTLFDGSKSVIASITISTHLSHLKSFKYQYRNANNSKQFVSWNINDTSYGNVWKHLLLSLEQSTATFYLDGTTQGFKQLEPLNIGTENTFKEGDILIGSALDQSNFTHQYSLQDIQVFETLLTSLQVDELYKLTAVNDVTPISGFLSFNPQQKLTNLSLHSVDDEVSEYNEEYFLTIVDAYGGGSIDPNNASMVVTVLKSDYSNGLFGFSKPCQPQHLQEGQSAICYVNRSRGLFGNVTVEWCVNVTGVEDFTEDRGTLLFLPGEYEKTFNITSHIDKVPEISEKHSVLLMKVSPLDGVASSASYSGASIDEGRASTDVWVEANERPNGVLQFTSGSIPDPEDNGKISEAVAPPVVHVEEEDGRISLVVERALGWFGDVTCEWRTRDGTAVSRQVPRDFLPAAGTLNFKDEQGYAELMVELVDDDVSELEKYFFVELSTPTGGASLNNASKVKVVIEPSDDAFGIFEFNETQQLAEEPSSGVKSVQIPVIRRGGHLGSALVFWRVSPNGTTDVTPRHGQLNFTEGEISHDVTLDVVADDVPEFDEVIKISLQRTTRGSIGSVSVCEVVISSNDDPRGVLTFDPLTASVNESDGNVSLTIRRSGGLAGTVRVYYETMNTNQSISESIALPAQDYKQVVQSVLIGENETTAIVTIPIFDDNEPETNEVFFVELVNVEMVSSGVSVPNSPRLGDPGQVIAEVIISENDSPHGVLELSAPSVRVDEDEGDGESNFLYVIRKLGSFGEVTVDFNVIADTAQPQEDYNVVSNKVTLRDREIKKAIPIRIVDDFTPELEERFTIELLPNTVTGGARVGEEVKCVVTIKESDDPYGLFEISTETKRVEEPSSGSGTPITFTVRRRSGVRGLVGIHYAVNITSAPSSAAGAFGVSPNPADSARDVDVREGNVYFISDVIAETFIIKVLPDDEPEDDELVAVTLERILSGSRGRIDPLHNQVRILIPANDRPYGDVSLQSNAITAIESDDEGDTASVLVERKGGLYGTLRVVYTTSEIDIVSEILQDHQNLMNHYLPSKIVDDIEEGTFFQFVDILTSDNPLVTCAEACLRERICRAFLFQNFSHECKWTTSESLDRNRITYAADDVKLSSVMDGRFSIYEKNQTESDLLYNSQARSGLDFFPQSGASILLHPGEKSAFINISILPDGEPELNEYFKINLLRVEMLNFTPEESNLPRILTPSSCRVTIEKNDYPYGIFVLNTPGQNTSLVEVEERPKLSLEVVVERQGGAVGSVTVEWAVVGGTATRNEDFSGDDATLRFDHGETTKVISLSLIDDATPEPDEAIQIQLSNPTGGAELDPDHDHCTVVILANDVVGGIVGFAPESKSVIAQEGKTVSLTVVRSEPAMGRCVVSWHGESVNGHDVDVGLNSTGGEVEFGPGETRNTIALHVTSDEKPETKEIYKIVLNHIQTEGISPSGAAILKSHFQEAEISIQESDDPHGIFQFAPDSQIIDIKEDEKILNIYVTRQFGSIGIVRVYYDVIPGTLSTVNPDLDIAQPGTDFIFTEDRPYITFPDQTTSLPIVINITNDDVPELIEIFHVNLTHTQLLNPDGRVITPLIPPKIDQESSLSQVVIDANDGTKGEISFNITSRNIRVVEGSTVLLSVYRDKGAYGRVKVFVYPQNSEAIQGVDYICQPETLTFNDGQRKADYVINILDDDVPEGDESFIVRLANPSAGVELGNITTATVTIASNDDAHGRLSFSNDRLIYIDEPDGHNSTGSTAFLSIVRNPPEGVFGEVSVRYRVQEITQNGDVIDSSANDIMPTSGYVTIGDGISETTLGVTAVPDNRPELDRKYRVTLFDPQRGATLDVNRTTSEIVIRKNDAPYGNFQIYPRGSRNGSKVIRLNEEKDQLLTVDVVRKQGTLGFVTVELQTVKGSAVPLRLSDSYAPILAPFQFFPKSTGVYFHAFQYKDSNYLIYLTAQLVSPLTTVVGSRGTFPSLTPGIHSTLYKWEGTYIPLQTIETDGASCVTSFLIDDVMYILITNEGEDGRRSSKSRLYKLTNNEELDVLQNVDTKGATCAISFKTDSTYVVVANSMDNNRVYSIDSLVLRFNVANQLLEDVQSLPTKGASGLTAFRQNSALYLAVANRFDSDAGLDVPVTSVVYRWNQEGGFFTNPISVDVAHAKDVEHLIVDEKCFLIFTSSARNNIAETEEEDSIKIFQVFPTSPPGHVVIRSHQRLNVIRPITAQLLTASSSALKCEGRIQSPYLKKNEVNLLMVSSEVQSRVFIFNFQTMLYTSMIDVMPASQLYPYVIVDANRSTAVVAVANGVTSPESPTHSDDVLKKTLDYSRFTSSAIYDVVNFHKSNATQLEEDVEGDYIPLKKRLLFRPGDTVRSVTINLMDDDDAEDEEKFQLSLSNRLDARAVVDDVNSPLDVIIGASDGAFGEIGFDQKSLDKSVEETSRDNVFTLNVVRHKASFGRVAVDWFAEGSVNDVIPISGEVVFEEGQVLASIQIAVLPDNEPEVEETVKIHLKDPKLLGKRSELQPLLNRSSSTSLVRILSNDSPHGVVRWSPISLRTVVKEPSSTSGSVSLVTLEMVREQGAMGDIEVYFKTTRADKLPASSQASPDADFRPRDSSLIMRENSTRAAVSINILQDDIPEDIETFYVVIYDVELIGQSKVGSKPGVGRNGKNVAEVSIDENDNARGFIQFNVTRNKQGAVDAYELPGLNNSLKLPLIRLVGSARSVGVEWLTRPITAQRSDFFPTSGTVQFLANSVSAEIEIFIRDDQIVEFMESFLVQLIGTIGGAKLGGDLTTTVNILPNDSPSGMFGFLQRTQEVKESSSASDPEGVVTFTVERFQGSNDKVTLSWELEESGREDLSPMSGFLVFPPGVRSRIITLRSLPDHVLEGEEKYELRLISASGKAEISPVAGTAQVVIAADRGAAGIVSLQTRNLFLSEPEKGMNGSGVILLHREQSAYGRVDVHWQIIPSDHSMFERVQGYATFEDGANTTSVLLQILDDDIPELSENFIFNLASVTGGARLNSIDRACPIVVVASDNPHGVFSFSQPLYHAHEASGDDSVTSRSDFVSTVTVSVVRGRGNIGKVSLRLKTHPGSALPNIDYYPVDERIIFQNGESIKRLVIEIINDNIPEGPKDFSLNVSDIRLHTRPNSHLHLVPPSNISINTPPIIGLPSAAVVRIAKNDGAEGIIEFGREEIRVHEEDGKVDVPLVRYDGTYGKVFVIVQAINETAQRNIDFLLPSAGVSVWFEDGQAEAHLSVTLIDDILIENEEKFTLAISRASRDVQIGKKKFIDIVILKSEHPDGIFQFVGDRQIVVDNPLRTDDNVLRFTLERTGGNQVPVSVRWRIIRIHPFYSPTTSLSPLSDDIGTPTSGEFYYKANEGGRREIEVRILPEASGLEPEEHFAVILEDADPAEISRRHGNITITVLKKGHPNGIVQFGRSRVQTQPLTQQVVEEPASGILQVVFPISRVHGSIGQLKVTWSLTANKEQDGANEDDVLATNGSVVMRDSQVNAEVLVTVLADEDPELDEIFLLKLTGVNGGAEINRNRSTQQFLIRANDDPHGIFSVKPENQHIIVTDHVTRLIRVNVTRDRGSFDKVAVGFSVQFDESTRGVSYLTTNTGTLLLADKVTWSSEDIEISSSVYLPVRSSFTIQLTNVEFIGRLLTINPIISNRYSRAQVVVPNQAGNARVGFNSSVANVFDVDQNLCNLTLIREGWYGDVSTQWNAGYPTSMLPPGMLDGRIAPSSGVVSMIHGTPSANFTVTVLPTADEAESFAVYILRASSLMVGEARVNRSRDLVEIDPCGAVEFARLSRKVTVSKDSRYVNLTVERLYGSRYDIRVDFTTKPVSAKPGIDYFVPKQESFIMKSGVNEGNITLHLPESNSMKRRAFQVLLTSAKLQQDQDVYRGMSPRIIYNHRMSHVTILEPRDAHGYIFFRDATVTVQESGDVSSDVTLVMVDVLRTAGAVGDASVFVTTISQGDPLADSGGLDAVMDQISRDPTDRAVGGDDYEIRSKNISFPEGTHLTSVPVVILNDDVTEPNEAFFLYLHSPRGGAVIDPTKRLLKVVISANDVPNGAVGFLKEAYYIDEDAVGSSNITLRRSHTFGNVTVKWRASSSPNDIRFGGDVTRPSLNDDTSLVTLQSNNELLEELEATSGEVFCPAQQQTCVIGLEVKDDQIPEFAFTFFLEIYDVSEGAEIDPHHKVANVTIGESDHPRGLFQFSPSSRLLSASESIRTIELTIERVGGRSFEASVEYAIKPIDRALTIAGITFYPTSGGEVSGNGEKVVQFDKGEREMTISIEVPTKTPSNPLPQMFQVVLVTSSGGSRLSKDHSVANVTIFGSVAAKRFWGVYELLQEELKEGAVQHVITIMKEIADDDIKEEEIKSYYQFLNTILEEERMRSYSDDTLQQLFGLFCKLLDPTRRDAVRGYSDFIQLIDRFTLSLTSETGCVDDDVQNVMMSSCQHVTIQSMSSFPELLNGHMFTVTDKDYFKIPPDFFDAAKYGVASPDPQCFQLYFAQLSSSVWFETSVEKTPMSNRIFSVGVGNFPSRALSAPVRYRVYTNDARISPQGAECVIWNQGLSRWIASSDRGCKVVEEGSNFIECECNHMSVYAVRGPVDNLVGYNEANYVASFLTLLSCLLIVVYRLVCATRYRYATKLFIHMIVACAGTQLFFVICALSSKSVSEESCSVLALIFHYFWLSQFTWMLVQMVNLLQTLSFNKKNPEKMFILYFLVAWGIPIVIILIYVAVMFAVGTSSMHQVYGDVYDNKKMCCMMSSYGAVLAAVLPACLCLLLVITILFHLYQKEEEWKKFDDVWLGSRNSKEIALLSWLFFLISLAWLFGGLHLAYGSLWMLILFIISNFILGIFLFVIYGILRSPLMNKMNTTYEESPDNTRGYQTATFSAPPSTSGDVINKSTQSLMKLDGWGETERQILADSIFGLTQTDIKDDSVDFDDLISALNTETDNVIKQENPYSPEEMEEVGGEENPVSIRESDLIPKDEDSRHYSIDTTASVNVADTHL